DLFGDPTFATQLREAVIAAVTVSADGPSGKRRTQATSAPTIATAASTLKSKLALEDTPLTAPEQALMEQWLTTLADASAVALAARSPRYPHVPDRLAAHRDLHSVLTRRAVVRRSVRTRLSCVQSRRPELTQPVMGRRSPIEAETRSQHATVVSLRCAYT